MGFEPLVESSIYIIQETRMLSQALNRAILHSRNQLEEVNRKKLILSCINNLDVGI